MLSATRFAPARRRFFGLGAPRLPVFDKRTPVIGPGGGIEEPGSPTAPGYGYPTFPGDGRLPPPVYNLIQTATWGTTPPISTQPMPPLLVVTVPLGPDSQPFPPSTPPTVPSSSGGGGPSSSSATTPTLTVEAMPPKKPWWPWVLGLAVVGATAAAIAHAR